MRHRWGPSYWGLARSGPSLAEDGREWQEEHEEKKGEVSALM